MSDMPSRSYGRKSIAASLKPRSLMDGPGHLAHAWRAVVITLLPDAFPGILGQSLTGKALKDGIWQLDTVDLRQFGEGKHRNVDDTPAGGGAGMVLRADVMGRAIDHAQTHAAQSAPLIYLSPRGKPFDQAHAKALSTGPGVTLICGRFEGMDQRVIDHYGIEEVSLGDFVMTGGDIAAQAMIDATVRLLPGVLGNESSTEEESFSNGLLEHPHYTRPATWQGHGIPDVLTSGNHGEIAKWRREMSEALTKERRPDLWEKFSDDNLPAELSAVYDAKSFIRFAKALFFDDTLVEPYASENGPEAAIEALVACVEDNKFDVTIPTNPWRAAAYVLWLGRIYE